MTDFQSAASAQGRQFAQQCDLLLTGYGFDLRGRRVLGDIGVEVDQVAMSSTGAEIWFEYKGSVQGSRPGLLRTDTLKKAVANGALLKAAGGAPPYIVLTSHLPARGSGKAMLTIALRAGYFADVVCLYDPAQTARLKSL